MSLVRGTVELVHSRKIFDGQSGFVDGLCGGWTLRRFHHVAVSSCPGGSPFSSFLLILSISTFTSLTMASLPHASTCTADKTSISYRPQTHRASKHSLKRRKKQPKWSKKHDNVGPPPVSSRVMRNTFLMLGCVDRVQKLKDARSEAAKEIEAYKAKKDQEFKKFESDVSGIWSAGWRCGGARELLLVNLSRGRGR